MNLRTSKAFKDLVLILAVSILLYALSLKFGAFDLLGKWGRQGSISKAHLEELILILVVSGLAFTTFYIRSWKELREEVLDRKRSEEILRDSRNKIMLQHKELNRLFRQVEIVKNEWERTLDCVGDMVILSDDEGKVTRCNKAFKSFTGQTFQELRGKSVESLLAEHGIDAKDLQGQRLEVHCKTKGRWYELKSYPYTDFMNGDISGSVIIIHDLTEHKRLWNRENGETKGTEGWVI
ncbi:MAG: PAS domain S-box protein [Deltaproteobacteria bacterium]|nr:PAS domain S-box protein [Deltaproteobacteria bacterium]